MSNTVAGRRQFENSQECIAKERQWHRHANENTPEKNASILATLFGKCVTANKAIVNHSPRILPLLSSVCGISYKNDSMRNGPSYLLWHSLCF